MFSVLNQQLTNGMAGRMGLPLFNDFNNIAWGTSQKTPFDIVGENRILGNAFRLIQKAIRAIPEGWRQFSKSNGLAWNSQRTAPYTRQWVSGRFGTTLNTAKG